MAYKLGKIKHFTDEDVFGKYNILYLNINSIRDNSDELEHIVMDKCIYFIVLTGTKITKYQNSSSNLKNYQSYFSNRGDGKGGVAIYVHQSLISTQQESDYTDNVHQLVVKIHSLGINLGVIYTLPDTNKERALQSYNQLLKSYQNMIMFADIDINLLDTENRFTQQYKNDTWNQGFSILNRIDACSGTKLVDSQFYPFEPVPMIVDHIVTDLKSFDYTVSLSDFVSLREVLRHKRILLSFNDHKSNRVKFYTAPKMIRTKEINPRKYSSLLTSINITANNFDDWIEILLSVKNSSSTFQWKDITADSALPWLTPELHELVQKRNAYYKLWKDAPYSSEAKTMFNELNEQVKKMRESLRSQYNGERINECVNNPKKLTTIISQIMENKNSEYDKVKAIRLEDGALETRPKRIANRFNEYFKEAALDLYNDIPNDALAFFDTLERNPYRLAVHPVTESEIAQKIAQIKPTTHRNEIITGQLLKANSDILVPVLTKLVNVCFVTGRFPDYLKVARIVPKHKNDGDRLDVSNYRPINILQSLSKLIEMVIYERITRFCLENDIFYQHQFAFLKKSGAAGAAVTVLDYVRANINDNKFGVCVFMDLKKAVDTIPHERLIEKLDDIGIRGKLLNLIKSYLQGRKQFVDIHGTKSPILDCNPIGIPQGSNVGTLFFILYLNDLFNLPFIGKIVVYCDDITLVYVSGDAKRVEAEINYDLDLLNNWLIFNKLTINMEKIKYMVMAENKKFFNVNLQLTVKDQQIELVRSQKYLGLRIQHNLKWNQQVSNVRRNIENVAGTIKRLGTNVSLAARKQFYFQQVHKHFTMLSVYGPFLSDVNVNTLQRAQDKAIRRLFGRDSDGRSDTDRLYEDMRIMKVYQIIKLDSILLHRKMQMDFNQFGRNVRGNNKELNNSRTFEGSAQYKCEAAYNELEEHIKGVQGFTAFKASLKRVIFSNNE